MKVYSIDGAYSLLKLEVINKGELFSDERGDKVYQIPFINLQFDKTIHQNIHNITFVKLPQKNVNNELLLNYSKEFFDEELHGFVYTYANRFMKHFNVNQYEYMVNNLRKNVHSRRSFAVTMNPKIDCFNDEIPCLQEIILGIYNDELVMTVLFRSNDLRYAFKYNIYALLNLQEYFAKELNVGCGDFYYNCCNLHYKVERGE